MSSNGSVDAPNHQVVNQGVIVFNPVIQSHYLHNLKCTYGRSSMIQSRAEYIEELKAVCQWCGITKGRTKEYMRYLQEFDQGENLSSKHILAYYESYEVRELYQLWKGHADEFPGLKKKIVKVCEKGPFLRESENPGTSSNRPRNDAFCFLAAGKFLTVGINVVNVDGVAKSGFAYGLRADFAFKWKESIIVVECKRPQSEKTLCKRVKEAQRQIRQSCHRGIIAIDCSILLRPPGTVYETPSAGKTQNELSQQLELMWEGWLATKKVQCLLSQDILGVLLFAKLPAMTAINIVDPNGNPIRRRDYIASWLMVGGSDASDSNVLQNLTCMLNKTHRTCTNE